MKRRADFSATGGPASGWMSAILADIKSALHVLVELTTPCVASFMVYLVLSGIGYLSLLLQQPGQSRIRRGAEFQSIQIILAGRCFVLRPLFEQKPGQIVMSFIQAEI